MTTTRNSRTSRLRRVVLAATVVGAFAAPAAAEANVYCVNTPSCFLGSQRATIEDALDSAAANGKADIIRIGPGTYEGPWGYSSPEALTIKGTGTAPGAVVLRANADANAVLGLHSTTLQNVTVRAQGPMNTALELTDSRAQGVAASTEDPDGLPAVRLHDGGRVEESGVSAPNGLAVRADCDAGCSVTGSLTESQSGVAAAEGADLTLDGVRVKSEQTAARSADDGTRLTLRRSLITTSAGDATAVGIGPGTVGSLRHVTIARTGASSQAAGIAVQASGGDASGVVADAVAIEGYAVPIFRVGSGAPADLTARASAWDRSKEMIGAAQGPGVVDVAPSNVNLAGRNAGFTDQIGGEFQPAPGSPLLDGVPGAPPAGFADINGAGATDGDGNGTVEADIGAFEGAAGEPQPQQPPVGGGGGGGEQPPAGGEQPPAAEQPPAGTQPDALAPVLSALRAKKRGRTIRVSFKLSEPGTVALRIERRRGRRFVTLARTRTLKAVAGRNRATLRLKSAPRGSYRVVAGPIDAAGNRGKRSRATVR